MIINHNFISLIALLSTLAAKDSFSRVSKIRRHNQVFYSMCFDASTYNDPCVLLVVAPSTLSRIESR